MRPRDRGHEAVRGGSGLGGDGRSLTANPTSSSSIHSSSSTRSSSICTMLCAIITVSRSGTTKTARSQKLRGRGRIVMIKFIADIGAIVLVVAFVALVEVEKHAINDRHCECRRRGRG